MIIDFHTHVFPEKIAKRAIEALSLGGAIKPHTDGTVSGALQSMERSGVDLAINLPPLTNATQFSNVLKYANELNSSPEAYPRVMSFAGIHPDEPDVEQRLSEVLAAGIRGIKIHPDFQGAYIDDERYVRILSEAKRLGLITVTHAGYDVGYFDKPVRCYPKRILRLLDKIGGYPKLVLAHIGSNAMSSEVLETLAGTDVYFDTAYTLHDIDRSVFLGILEKHGDDKILFATDSPWRDQKEEIELLKSYNLGAETEEKIFSANAKRLLGI